DLESLLETLNRRRFDWRKFVRQEALEVQIRDRLSNGSPVHFLSTVDFMTTRIPACMEVADIGNVLPDGPNEIPFHNLHVIDVEKQLHTRRVDALHQLDAPGRMI